MARGKSMAAAGFAKKRDANEPAIVDALEAVGAVVVRISMMDVPDLLVGFRGDNFMLEVKNGKAKPSPGQSTFHAEWRGKPIVVVRGVDEALTAIGIAIVSPGMYKDTDGALKTYPRGK